MLEYVSETILRNFRARQGEETNSFRLFTRETYGERKASWLNKITKFN